MQTNTLPGCLQAQAVCLTCLFFKYCPFCLIRWAVPQKKPSQNTLPRCLQAQAVCLTCLFFNGVLFLIRWAGGFPKGCSPKPTKRALSCCLTLFLSRCPQCLSASKAVPKKRKDALGLSRSGYRRSFLPGCPCWFGCGTPAQRKAFPSRKNGLASVEPG